MASDREMLLDASVVGATSGVLCLAAGEPALMLAWVILAAALRTWLWARLHRAESEDLGGALRVELAFLLVCTLLGGFNDWISVVHRRIYDYSVPVLLPGLGAIPIWMLLYWGLILRFLFTLSRWRRLGAPAEPDPRLCLGRRVLCRRPWARVLAMLLLVLLTRQLIYRFYLDPLLSWLPFLLALALFPLLFGASRHDLRLLAFMLILGPAAETLYIQVAGLHRYALGWLGGVPLWIVLWWALATLVWKELGWRLHSALTVLLAGRRPG